MTTSGDAVIGGVRYVDLVKPLIVVGALLDAGATHKGPSARRLPPTAT